MEQVETTEFRVLVVGYINLNVIDGSAFFISGLASMLSELPAVEVDVVSANPIEKTDVLDEVLYRRNVQIIDPYSDSCIEHFGEVKRGKNMSRLEYAELIARIGLEYDAVILRDTECASHVVKICPELGSRLFAYVTGIRTVGQELETDLKQQLESIESGGANFICQTRYIESALIRSVPGLEPSRVHILTPHVPGEMNLFEEVFDVADRYDKFVYTGKFFDDWNTDRILASFKDLNQQGYSLFLDVAGDQFRHSKTNPNFVKNNRWLLDSTPGVTWHGRVPRAQSRKIILNSQIGIGWRSESLNNSSELSTKILEYGILGRPSILNRTPLHEELLGSDYPLFANSMTEFKELLRKIPDDFETVKLAAERCFTLAKEYSYSAVRPSLLEFLGNSHSIAGDRISVCIDELGSTPIELAGMNHKVQLRGQWVDILTGIDSKLSVGDQIDLVLREQENLLEFEDALRERKELFLSSFQSSLVTPHATLDTPVNTSKASIGSKQASESSLQKIARLEAHIAELNTEHRETKDRLNALRNSRLGKLQIDIWKQKGGREHTKLPSTSLINDIVRRVISKLLRMSKK